MGEEIIALIIMLSMFFFIFYFTFWFAFRAFKRTAANFKKLGEKYNLGVTVPTSRWQWFMGGLPEASGKIEDYYLVIDMFTRGSGKHKSTYTRFSMNINYQGGENLILFKEGLLSKIGKAMGKQDIEIGDEELDKKYIIRADNESFAKRILNLRMKSYIKKNLDLGWQGKLELEGDSINYEAQLMLNSDKSYEQFLTVIKTALELAREIKR